jgi:hypothetical protein
LRDPRTGVVFRLPFLTMERRTVYLNVPIEPVLRRRVKKAAIDADITLRQFVEQALEAAVAKAEKSRPKR